MTKPRKPRKNPAPDNRVKASRREIVDSDGRRIGYMWPEDLCTMCEVMWGKFKWRNELARYAGVSYKWVTECATGQKPISKVLAQLVRLRYFMYHHRLRKIPVNEAPWLEDGWEPYK